MRPTVFARCLRILIAAAAVGACAGEAEPPRDTDDGAAAHGMSDMPMDPAMMQRHAHEADSLADRMRSQLRDMRSLPPEQWHARMDRHAAAVSEMLALMTRQMREMDMGMGMDDEQMGRMMGMSAAEHRQLRQDMQALRSETEQLQTAEPRAVRERMPAHLDRIDDVLTMLERSAAHMRGGHVGHGQH